MAFFKDLLSDLLDESFDEPSPHNRSSLDTPPPVPKFESITVMVAINGQSYGPYEKSTLLELIENGSLTPDTFVFMQGMREWKRACEVQAVAQLFESQIPIPPIPPVPGTEAPVPPDAQIIEEPDIESDNTLSPRLNKLITAAVADGEISDLERRVLIRNAQEEGVAMDEFVMVLEARLFEQRQILRTQWDEMANRAKAMEAQQKAATLTARASVHNQPAMPRTKCPHCGYPIKTLATCCPECGHDYINNSNRPMSAWECLSQKIQEISNDNTVGNDNSLIALLDLSRVSDPDRDKNAKIINVINNFPIPTDKQELVDFMVACAPLGKPSGLFAGKPYSVKNMEKAYYAKAQQVVLKARIVLRDDPSLLKQIESIAKQYNIKA